MPAARGKPQSRDDDRIDVQHDYAVCAWARHFNASERRIREAVAAVGDRAGSVREHLEASSRAAGEHPSS